MSPQQIELLFKVLDILALGLKLAPELKASYDQSKSKLEQIIKEGRDPSPEEWNELNSRIDALQAALDN